ncbi:HlyD family efflux transporter periplasmic adaptor subunit [Pedobacter chinensis]|uniref:HlyD family efflux transporter periplasmic adaptor subunit n=1 Tax=Pedobacter chinensis TaxID=2282421 RepID=A0A369Q2Z3_9SPHI|nr:HlyD family efflux transporter periplasmic adaptor subunit [Pedobacter chinensis]RDC57309.1 HlyD family efflux transporter periplasmic adaptor subunit [Pedobacter chinensis]
MPILSEKNVANTSLIFLHQTRTRSQIIYSVTLFAILTALGALPFLYTTVSVKGIGSLQSNIEKTELLAPVSGKITQINLADNEQVKKGALLLSIDSSLPEKQHIINKTHVGELKSLLKDALIVLKQVDLNNGTQPALQTGLYIASWQQYKEQSQNAINACEQAHKVYNRYELLFNKKVVTQVEYEQYKFNYEQALSDFKLVTKKYKTQWQTESNQYRKELKELENQNVQLTEQEKLYNLTAQISGTIQNLSGLQSGSFVSTGQKIGEISPDSALLAICFIKPSDIGLIKKGQQVRFQVDAFNYNQWGLLTGNVYDISEDVVLVNQTPYFKVKCKLKKDFLQLGNGYKGVVKKGMSLSAHFTITRRSLYQLLYDKMDDWLNPSI